MYVQHITGGKNRDDMSIENEICNAVIQKNESMMSLKIFKSVTICPPRDSKKKYRSNPLSVTSVCFSFVWANHIKGNGIDKTVHGPNCKFTSPLEVLFLM